MCKKKFNIANNKFEELLASSKLKDILHKKEDPIEEKKHTVVFVLAIIGAVAAVAGIAYCVYKCLNPSYLDDFDECDDDFDCDFDDECEKKEECEAETEE